MVLPGQQLHQCPPLGPMWVLAYWVRPSTVCAFLSEPAQAPTPNYVCCSTPLIALPQLSAGRTAT